MPRRPLYYDTITFELNDRYQQWRALMGDRRVTGNLTYTRPKVEVRSLADLSLQAHFGGYGFPKLWGALKALVEIQKKWIHFRGRAYRGATYVVQDVFRNLIPKQSDMANIRRYNRIKLALRTSQARVRASKK